MLQAEQELNAEADQANGVDGSPQPNGHAVNGDGMNGNGEMNGHGGDQDGAGGQIPIQGERQPNKVRVTTPYLTKYERARVLGTRALQIRYVWGSTLYFTLNHAFFWFFEYWLMDICIRKHERTCFSASGWRD